MDAVILLPAYGVLVLIYRLCLWQADGCSFPAWKEITQSSIWLAALSFAAFSFSALAAPYLLSRFSRALPDQAIWILLATAVAAPLSGPVLLLHGLYRLTWGQAFQFAATMQILAIAYGCCLAMLVIPLIACLTYWG